MFAIALLTALVPAGSASHADGDYEIPLLFEWHTSDLDILIVPPEHGQLRNNEDILDTLDPNEAHPCTMAWTRAIRDGIQNWKVAIEIFGAPWVQEELAITVHVVACDDPQTFPEQPEILVATGGTLGPALGLAVPGDPCIALGSRLDYKSGRNPNYADMFNVMSHEVGHCFGLGHTGFPDAGTVGGGAHPAHDTMEGGYEHWFGTAGTHRHCVSNLDVRGLEAVFDDSVNRTEIVRMPVAEYALAENPLCNSVLLPGGG